MKIFTSIWLLTFGLAGCLSPQLSVSSVNYLSIINENNLAIDSSVEKAIEPYRRELEVLMNDTLCYLNATIKKSDTNMPLGTWLASTCFYWAKSAGYEPDLAIFNQGGIRIPELSQGYISRGRIYELMPFDNELVILTIPYDSLIRLINELQLKGGEPAFGLQCVDGGYLINQQPIADYNVVRVLTSDFLWKGGDKFTQLSSAVEVKQSGVLIREAIISQMLKSDTCSVKQEKGVWCAN